MSYSLSFTSFETMDGLTLPGLLYEPPTKTKQAAIWLHGNGGASVFYSPTRMNELGRILTENGICFFPFNNRGAHIMQSVKRSKKNGEKVQMGSAYELIQDCSHDIDGAILFLQKKGYTDIYLLGHSTGANKICIYNYYKPDNPISRYVLLAGGDDTGLFYHMVGEQVYRKALSKCAFEIKYGNGHKLAAKYVSPFMLSYQSLFDQIDPDGDYNVFPFSFVMQEMAIGQKQFFQEFAALSKPTLVLYGSEDEYVPVSVDAAVTVLQNYQNPSAPIEYELIEGADHGFDGYEKTLGERLVAFLMR